MAFDQANSIESLDKLNNAFKDIGLRNGQKFDGHKHNWMILNEYISLGFDYISFVIKDTIEQVLLGLSAQETKIFEDQDLLVTQHTQVSEYLVKDQDGNDITTVQVIPRATQPGEPAKE